MKKPIAAKPARRRPAPRARRKPTDARAELRRELALNKRIEVLARQVDKAMRRAQGAMTETLYRAARELGMVVLEAPVYQNISRDRDTAVREARDQFDRAERLEATLAEAMQKLEASTYEHARDAAIDVCNSMAERGEAAARALGISDATAARVRELGADRAGDIAEALIQAGEGIRRAEGRELEAGND